MAQPVPTWKPYADEAEALAALGVDGSTLPAEEYDNGPRFVAIGLESERAVAEVDPDFARLKKLGQRGFYVFAGEGTRWKTRMFGTGLGGERDPATGSAAGPLGVHLLPPRPDRVGSGDRA